MRFPFPPDEEVVQPPEMEDAAKSPERNIRVTGIAAETAPPAVTVVAPAQPEVTEESIVATGPPEIAPESVPELLRGSGASVLPSAFSSRDRAAASSPAATQAKEKGYRLSTGSRESQK